MIDGSCCCGAVQFSLSRKPEMVGACHCSRCRKLGATPFAMIEAEAFTLTRGREHIVRYAPEPPFEYVRAFCGRCGTSLGEMTSADSAESVFPVPANCFDEDLGVAIRFREHVASKPSWCVIADDARQFDGDPS